MNPLTPSRELALTDDERVAWCLIHRLGVDHLEASKICRVHRVTLTRRVCRARAKIARLKLLIADIGGDAADVDRLAGLSRGEGQN